MSAPHQQTLCSRFNKEVESTLMLRPKDLPAHDLSKCPNGSTSTAMCHAAAPFVYPPWVIEAEQRNKTYMDEVVKCRGR